MCFTVAGQVEVFPPVKKQNKTKNPSPLVKKVSTGLSLREEICSVHVH